MEKTTAVLVVPNRDTWERQFKRYMTTRKRVGGGIGLIFGTPLLLGVLYLATVLLPLVRGDIAPGHPSYQDYRAGTDTALLVGAVSFVLYTAASVMFGRWLRKTHVLLGFQPDGTFVEVREAAVEISAKA